MITYSAKSPKINKNGFEQIQNEENPENMEILEPSNGISTLENSHETTDINVVVVPKIERAGPIYNTMFMKVFTSISAIVMISLTVGLSIYANEIYFEYSSFHENQIYYYCDSENFPELHNGIGPLEFGDLQNNIVHIKSLGVGSIIIEKQHIYRTNYAYSANLLSSFALACHAKEISVYLEWENIGTTLLNSSFNQDYPDYCSNDEMNGYKILNYQIPEVYKITYDKLKEFSLNYVDGYIFNDIPRIVDTITKNLTIEIDKKALELIKDELNHILSSKMQTFAPNIPTINYPSTLEGVNLDGYVYEIGSLTSLNNQNIFDEINRILSFKKILSVKALIIVTTKTKFAQEMNIFKLDGIKLLAIFGFVPGSLLISPRIEFCGDSFVNYTQALKDMSDLQQNCARSIDELMNFRNNKLGSRFYQNLETVLLDQNSLFMVRTQILGTSPVRLVLLWNSLTTENSVDLSNIARIKDNEKIKALYSSNKPYFRKTYNGNAVDLESLEVVILSIE